MDPRSLESREVEDTPGRLIASWAPSVQNKLGPDIDLSSCNIENEVERKTTILILTWRTFEMAGKWVCATAE